MPSGLFYLIVVDRDRGEFTVEGPMANDAAWSKAVIAAQKAGRQITCSTAGPGTYGEISERFKTQSGHKQRLPGSLLTLSPK
jgi:hypothetical protein